jgi:hypothetical protein
MATSVSFDADAIIPRVPEPLFAAEIPLSHLDAYVPSKNWICSTRRHAYFTTPQMTIGLNTFAAIRSALVSHEGLFPNGGSRSLPTIANPGQPWRYRNRPHMTALADGEKPVALFAHQRVTDAYATPFRSFHPANSGRQIRAQQPRIYRLIRQSPNRCEPKVDGRFSVAFLFQIDAIASHGVLLKASRGSGQYGSMSREWCGRTGVAS